jgi:plastocyanin domain-containing protein
VKFAIAIASLAVGLQFATAAPKDNGQVVVLQITEKGFVPEKVDVKPGTPVVLKITRKTDDTCAKQIKISSRNIKKDLPLNQTVSIDLGKLEKGDIAFACGMDMMTGHIIVQ